MPAGTSPALAEIASEEVAQLAEGDEVHPVIEIHVTGPRDDDQFLGFGRPLIGVLAELDGMGLLTGDEEHRARRDSLDGREGIEVHEAADACKRRLCRL
jgi:hypothetical protein